VRDDAAFLSNYCDHLSVLGRTQLDVSNLVDIDHGICQPTDDKPPERRRGQSHEAFDFGARPIFENGEATYIKMVGYTN